MPATMHGITQALVVLVIALMSPSVNPHAAPAARSDAARKLLQFTQKWSYCNGYPQSQINGNKVYHKQCLDADLLPLLGCCSTLGICEVTNGTVMECHGVSWCCSPLHDPDEMPSYTYPYTGAFATLSWSKIIPFYESPEPTPMPVIPNLPNTNPLTVPPPPPYGASQIGTTAAGPPPPAPFP